MVTEAGRAVVAWGNNAAMATDFTMTANLKNSFKTNH